MVVFGNHILLFSDKSITFNEEAELSVAWKRWYRRAVAGSAKQLQGAERWIRTHPDRLYSDRQCKKKFHVPIPDLSTMKVHKIIVANGASEACKKFFERSSGSLMVSSHQTAGDDGLPFTLYQEIGDEFFHVFDDVTLGIVLEYLDTPNDLLDYLDAKEKLFQSGVSVFSAGEEETLGLYLQTIVNDRHGFDFDQVHGASISEGFWEEFLTSDLLASKVKADIVSYLWDEIVKKSTSSFVDGTAIIHSETTEGSHSLYSLLASPTRFERRMLGGKLHALQLDRKGPKAASMVLLERRPTTIWVLLVIAEMNFPQGHPQSYDEFRRNQLCAYVEVAMYLNPEAEQVVGLAMSGIEDQFTSEDFVVMSRMNWNEDLEMDARYLHEEKGIFKNLTKSDLKPFEYPVEASKNIDRDDK